MTVKNLLVTSVLLLAIVAFHVVNTQQERAEKIQICTESYWTAANTFMGEVLAKMYQSNGGLEKVKANCVKNYGN